MKAPQDMVPPIQLAGESAPQTNVESVAATVQAERRADHWDAVINGGVGITGGVLGAIIGAWVAYYLGLKAAREANARAEAIRDNQLRFSVTHKLNKIYSAQKEVRRTCDEAVARLAASRERAAVAGIRFLDHLCLELRPFATSVIRLNFTPDEVAQVGKGGDQGALKIMMMLDDRHNTTADLLDEFRSLKAEFESLVHRDGEFEPNRGYMQFRWTNEQYDSYRPYLFKMDKLAEAIHAHSAQDERDCFSATVAVAKLQAKGNAKVDIRIATPDGRIARVTQDGVEYFDADAELPLAGAQS